MRWQSIALLPIFFSWRFPQTGFGRGWRGREKKRWGPNTSHKTPSPAKDPRRQQLLLAACFENLDRKEKTPLTKQLHEKCSPKYKSAWYVSPIPNVSTQKPAADSVIMKPQQNWSPTFSTAASKHISGTMVTMPSPKAVLSIWKNLGSHRSLDKFWNKHIQTAAPAVPKTPPLLL